MILLTDTFNRCTISRHRTVKAAVKADKAHNKAVKRANGQSSYIPTSITAEDGRDISEEIERERMALNCWQLLTVRHNPAPFNLSI